MVNLLLWSFREGDRGEYLAQYMLSALGVCVPVPRQEDIGIDFHCTLATKSGNQLKFADSFQVQVKAISLKDSIVYGGPDEKSGRWKDQELDWVINRELPLLIGLIDKKGFRLDLFPISNVWFGWYAAGMPGAVWFKPNEPPGADAEIPRPSGEPQKGWPQGIGDGKLWQVPLGVPVVSMHLEDLEDQEKIASFRRILTWVVRMERQNIILRQMGVHFCRWPLKITTNDEFKVIYGLGVVGNVAQGANTDAQLKSLTPILAALAANFKAQNRLVELEKVKQFVSLLDADSAGCRELRKLLPDLFN